MIDHAPDCEVLTGGVCTCNPLVTTPHPHPKAGTSRTVDTEPKVTWLGDRKFTHPPTCAAYRHQGNWAPYCDCHISRLNGAADPPMIDPDHVPKEFEPIPALNHVSRFPADPSLLAPWVYLWLGGVSGGLLGFAAGIWAGVSLPW